MAGEGVYIGWTTLSYFVWSYTNCERSYDQIQWSIMNKWFGQSPAIVLCIGLLTLDRHYTCHFSSPRYGA